jgi:hypothetical protein
LQSTLFQRDAVLGRERVTHREGFFGKMRHPDGEKLDDSGTSV